MNDPNAPIPTEDEVLAALAPLAARIAKSAITNKSEVLSVLLSADGAREIIAAAFEEGERNGHRAAVTAVGGTNSTGAPDWSDIEGQGERSAIAQETSICWRCSHSPVCRVAPPKEMLVVISRCAAFAEV